MMWVGLVVAALAAALSRKKTPEAAGPNDGPARPGAPLPGVPGAVPGEVVRPVRLDGEALRRAAVGVALSAVHGNPKLGDPVFEQVTEGRASWPGYSACADLPQYVWERLGLLSSMPALDNRGAHFEPSLAMTKIVSRTGDAYIPADSGAMPQPGDALFWAEMPVKTTVREHVGVLISPVLPSADGWRFQTADYGQRGENNKPSAAQRDRVMRREGGLLVLPDGRSLRGWVDLVRLAQLARGEQGPRPELLRDPFAPVRVAGEAGWHDYPYAIAWRWNGNAWERFPPRPNYGRDVWPTAAALRGMLTSLVSMANDRGTWWMVERARADGRRRTQIQGTAETVRDALR